MGQSLARASDPQERRSSRARQFNVRNRSSKSSSLSRAKTDSARAPLQRRHRSPQRAADTWSSHRQRSPLLGIDTTPRHARTEKQRHVKKRLDAGSRSNQRHEKASTRPQQGRKAERRTREGSPTQNHDPGLRSRNAPFHRRRHVAQSTPKASLDAMGIIPTKECMVCVENRPLTWFPARQPTSQCTHKISTCRACLRNWIRSEFSSKVWDQINCPECGLRMQHDDVRQFAPDDVFRQYDRLSTWAALESIPGFQWCIAKGCRSGQVHEGMLTPRFRCVACKASHCVVHSVKWHKGETCAEYDYRTDGKQKKAEEVASKKLVQETAKKCPKCTRHIEKMAGCDHMTCSKCRHEFCWVCLAAYGPIRKKGSEMHRRTCEYYYEVDE